MAQSKPQSQLSQAARFTKGVIDAGKEFDPYEAGRKAGRKIAVQAMQQAVFGEGRLTAADKLARINELMAAECIDAPGLPSGQDSDSFEPETSEAPAAVAQA